MKATQQDTRKAQKSAPKAVAKAAKKTASQKRLEKAQDALQDSILWIAELNEEGIIAIFKEVRRAKLEKAGYGGFLTAFAEAYLHADQANRELMTGVALAIIGKYGLNPMGPQEFSEDEWKA